MRARQIVNCCGDLRAAFKAETEKLNKVRNSWVCIPLAAGSILFSSPIWAEDLSSLWSYGLTSMRTGEPLVEEGGRHAIDRSTVAYGYNLVVDRDGTVRRPGGAPLKGGETLIRTPEYQTDHNIREYARIVAIMAAIRDALLYDFHNTSKDDWLQLTAELTRNNIKTRDAVHIGRRSVLSTTQVYDYIASGRAEGSPVMRYLEEAELELKCLAFKDFDFTNPEGKNHCVEQNLIDGAKSAQGGDTRPTRNAMPTSRGGNGFMDRFDSNRDGRVTKSEFPGPDVHFSRLDRNHDGYLSADEVPGPSRSGGGPGRR